MRLQFLSDFCLRFEANCLTKSINLYDFAAQQCSEIAARICSKAVEKISEAMPTLNDLTGSHDLNASICFWEAAKEST